MKPNDETPDRERLDELERCFECQAVIAPEDAHGMKVAEGIVLCPDCCAHAHDVEEREPGPQTLRLPPSWYDDVASTTHHT